MRQRAIAGFALLAIGIYPIYAGGLPFLFIILIFFGLAAWEYARLFQAAGFRPAMPLMVAATAAFLLARHFSQPAPLQWDGLVTLIFILLAMTVHLMDYERGAKFSGTDFAITLSGGMYLGFVGGYLIPLRGLPEGVWWFLATLPAVWLADSGAYFVGRSLGRRKMSPRLSPGKTWEGYLGGVIFGTLGNALLCLGWQAAPAAPDALTPWSGALIGLVLSLLTPLGDLGQSMLKRQAGIKDSSNILPGHGGIFDRVDSWIWAGAIGYYAIVWFFT
jgi:phosphatidate cytidylyltransferase